MQPTWRPHPQSGDVRTLAECTYFTVHERRGQLVIGGDNSACSIVVVLEGEGELHTRGGATPLHPTQSVLVSADAGEWHARAHNTPLRLLVARPQL